MMELKTAKVRIVLLLLIMITCIVPMHDVFANPSNQMISDECLKNPENCQQSPSAATDENRAAVGITAFDYIKMLVALLFVLGLLIFILRFINKRNVNYQQNSFVRNVGGVSVGQQKSVQVIQIGNSLYVVGVGEDVQLIKEITDPNEIEQLLNFYNEKQAITTTPYIAELLTKLKKKPNDEQKLENADFGDILNERLTNIKKERKHELEKWKEKERDK